MTLGKMSNCNRRGLLGHLGALAGLGILADEVWSAPKVKVPGGKGRAKTVLVLFAGGGPSQLETWDMRPEAPTTVRGAFKPIATTAPGMRICEHMPKLAKLAHHYSIYKTLSHQDLEHGSACYLALTGHYHPRKTSNPDPTGTDRPSVDCLARKLSPQQVGPFGAFHLNGPLLTPFTPGPGQYPGVLGPAFGAVGLGDPRIEPARALGLQVRHELPQVRIDGREILRQKLEGQVRALEVAQANDQELAHGFNIERAYRLLDRPQLRRAFELNREKPAVHEAYGRHRTGQACLLARNLVEAGVPWITVFLNQSIRGQDIEPDDGDACGWDTHNDQFESLEKYLLPRLDQAMSALLADLIQSGRIEDTLVLCLGEFGRAPLVAYEKRFVGNTPGRKHWSATYPMVVAGAGTRKGAIIGETDKHAAYPLTDPAGPWDVAITCLEALGIPTDTPVTDREGRLLTLPEGKMISRLWAG